MSHLLNFCLLLVSPSMLQLPWHPKVVSLIYMDNITCYITASSLFSLHSHSARFFYSIYFFLAFLFLIFPTSFYSFITLDFESSLFTLISWVSLFNLKCNIFRTKLLIFHYKPIPPVVFITSENFNSILSHNPWNHPWLFSLSHTPHLSLQEILFSLPSKYIQNLTFIFLPPLLPPWSKAL